MEIDEILMDAFSRVNDVGHETVSGLSIDELVYRPAPQANSIAWLIWHLSRIQDDHIADLAGVEQVWQKDWHERFSLPFNKNDTGYGHDSKDVAEVKVSSELLLGYHDAVFAKTLKYLHGIKAEDYKRVVDKRWNPPVTLAVRLMSIISDDLQHAGQAAYIRGLLKQ